MGNKVIFWHYTVHILDRIVHEGTPWETIDALRLPYACARKTYFYIVDWGKQFVSMTTDEKRAVLNQLINRIEVSRDYEIKILFNLSLEEFFGENSNKKIRRKAAKEAQKVPS